MKLKHNLIQPVEIQIPANETKIGDLMVVDGGRYGSKILLRTHNGFVSLSTLDRTWDHPTLLARVFYPGESVTLTQE